MKHLIFLYFIALAGIVPASAADVGVSISIGQPGFYGQLDIGDAPSPRVIYSRPVIIERAPRGVVLEPLYLRVPNNHASNWRRYCSRYNACGRPVYFVRNDWYNNVYAPHYRNTHKDDRRDERNDRDNRQDGRGNDRDNRDSDRGRGNNGRGKN